MCCLVCTYGTVPVDVVLSILYFGDCTRRCGVVYFVLRRLYRKMWCCLFGTSGIVAEDVLLLIWYFWDITRRCGVAYLVLLIMYQKMWFCLFGTSGTVPEDVILSILYFEDSTRRCSFAYLVLRGLYNLPYDTVKLLYHTFLQFTKSINLIPLEVLLIVQIKGKIKQSLYKPREVPRVPGSKN